jgi:hypothetical protein
MGLRIELRDIAGDELGDVLDCLTTGIDAQQAERLRRYLADEATDGLLGIEQLRENHPASRAWGIYRAARALRADLALVA